MRQRQILIILENTQVQDKIKEIIRPMKQGGLIFNLPEEDYEHRVAVNSMNIVAGCHIFRNTLRNWIKHDTHDFKTVQDVLESIYSNYHDTIECEIPEG